jgi:hypothetical protein
MTKNSSTSHGALRKNCVAVHAAFRSKTERLSCANPRPMPAAVPIAMAKAEMSRFSANPWSSRGAHLRMMAGNEPEGATVV